MNTRALGHARPLRAGLVIAALCAAGCTVRLVADYDAVLDQGVSDVSREVDAFLTKMERTAGTPAGAYASNAGFYTDTAASVRTLRLRAESSPRSGDLARSLDDILKSLESLRGVHEGRGDRGLPQVAVQTARSGLETQFKSLFVIESALRRGE